MKQVAKRFTFYYLCILFLEILYKVSTFHVFWNIELLYTAMFTVIYALILTVIIIFLPKKASFPVGLILMILITILFIGESMFSQIFDTTFSVYSLNMASQAYDFRSILFTAMKEHWLLLIGFLLPLIAYIIVRKRIVIHREIIDLPKYIAVFLTSYLIVMIGLSFGEKSTYSAYNLYNKVHAPTITVNKLGLLTEFRLDIKRYIFGFTPSLEIEDKKTDEIEEPEKPDVKYNKLDLNFDFSTEDSTISNLNSYFSNKSVTNQNEYTDIFKGKNLIYILAEGFNSIAVDENVTPTLYKMVNSSFIFSNYYSPVFMSTTGGEFQFSTTLIPTQKSLNAWKTGDVYFPYAVGNVFNNLGYTTNAYHDWTYTYYKRNKTMPTLGFTSYTGCGNGMEKLMNCKRWPTSDIEMFDATIPQYIDETNFATYYITVSGHAEYNFFGNSIAAKNKSAVADLGYTTPIKAYLATQIELDKALENMLAMLEEKGILDDTVIVLSGDHYPYTLNTDQINEISTYERDATFEVNHSNLIIYNPQVKTTTIDKLSSSVDVIPTLLNMFGYEYDSRLLIGSDIMSEHDCLVVFSDYSWISEKGRYSTSTSVFTPIEGVTVDEDYVTRVNQEVQNRVNASTQIVTSNYYKALFDVQTQSDEQN